MNEYLDHIAFYRDLPPERVEELRALIASDAKAGELFRAWSQMWAELGRRLDEAVPDTDLFVSFVLFERGHSEVLSPEERDRVERAAPALREALSRHGGLEGAADDISSAAEAFDQHWDEWFGGDRDDSSTPARRGHENRQMLPDRQGGRNRQARPDRHGRSTPSSRTDRPARPSRSSAVRWSARVAVLSALIVFAALIVFVLQRDHAMTSVTTAENETRVVDLGDGSSVRLLGNSRLSFTPPDDVAVLGRQAVLDGRAYFDVVPASDGLIVKTETAQLTVLGTSFGVDARDDVTEVVLAQGRLTLASRRAPRQIVTLSPGQMSRVTEDGRPTTPVDVVVHERLSWTGLFVFASAPVQEITQVLAEHYRTEITLPDVLEGERITGRFERGQDLEEILQTISAAIGVNVHRTPSGGYRLGTP